MQKRAVVGGAGGFIGHHLMKSLGPRLLRARRRPQGAGVRADGGRRVRAARPAPLGELPARHADVDEVYAARREHGRHRLHHRQQGRDHAQQRADQLAHARGGARERRDAPPFHVLERLHLPDVHAGPSRRDAAEGRGRLSGRRRGRLRLGEARSPSGSAGTTARTTALETRVARFHNIFGPLGTLRGRAREVARRHLPQGRAREQTASTSRSGATASRRAPSATSTTASRASTASCSPITASR